MREKLTNNWVLKVMALVFAVLLWLGVVNMTDPVIVKTISNIPIEVRNEQVLTDQGRTYEMNTTGTVDVSIRQTRYSEVTASDITLYVDLQEWYPDIGTLPVHMEVKSGAVREGDCTLRTTVAQIETYTLETMELSIELNVSGEPADGYNIVDRSVSPGSVTVEGPSVSLGRLERAVVNVDVSGQSSTVDTTGNIVLYDKNGDVVSPSSEMITLSITQAQVHLEILQSKTVPVVIGEINGQAAEGYRYSDMEQSIDSLEIFGTKSVLSQITGIIIDSSDLTVEGATEDIVLEFDLRDYLPDGVILLADEETTLTVTLKIERLEQRTFTLGSSNISIIGMEDNLEYSISSETPSTVTVEGLGEDLDRLDIEDLNAQLDVTGLGVGTHQLNLSVSVDNAFEVTELSRVTILISDRTEEGTGTSGESQESAGSSKP